MLSEVNEAPRELAEAVDEDVKEMKRELGAQRKLHSSYNHNNYHNDFWSRTERYCNWYPDSCFDFCDWYPSYCDEFCVRFPEYCEAEQPQCVEDQYKLYDFLRTNGIYS